MRDRNPLSPFGPGYGIMFSLSMVIAVAVPPLGMFMLLCLWLVYLKRKARVNKLKAGIARRAAEKDERERILAWKSL